MTTTRDHAIAIGDAIAINCNDRYESDGLGGDITSPRLTVDTISAYHRCFPWISWWWERSITINQQGRIHGITGAYAGQLGRGSNTKTSRNSGTGMSGIPLYNSASIFPFPLPSLTLWHFGSDISISVKVDLHLSNQQLPTSIASRIPLPSLKTYRTSWDFYGELCGYYPFLRSTISDTVDSMYHMPINHMFYFNVTALNEEMFRLRYRTFLSVVFWIKEIISFHELLFGDVMWPHSPHPIHLSLPTTNPLTHLPFTVAILTQSSPAPHPYHEPTVPPIPRPLDYDFLPGSRICTLRSSDSPFWLTPNRKLP